jgi:hypothetical protein
VACGREGAAPTPRPEPVGAVIRLGYPAEPGTLDPVAQEGASRASRDILEPVLPSLFRLDENLNPHPDLVAGWPEPEEISFDPFTVSLRLREPG